MDNLSQAIINATIALKNTEKLFEQSYAEAKQWQQKEQIFLKMGDQASANEAALNKKKHTSLAKTLKARISELTVSLEKLQQEWQRRTVRDTVSSQTLSNVLFSDQTDVQFAITSIENLERKFYRILSLCQEACQELAELKSQFQKELPRAQISQSDTISSSRPYIDIDTDEIDKDLENLKKQLDEL